MGRPLRALGRPVLLPAQASPDLLEVVSGGYPAVIIVAIVRMYTTCSTRIVPGSVDPILQSRILLRSVQVLRSIHYMWPKLHSGLGLHHPLFLPEEPGRCAAALPFDIDRFVSIAFVVLVVDDLVRPLPYQWP